MFNFTKSYDSAGYHNITLVANNKIIGKCSFNILSYQGNELNNGNFLPVMPKALGYFVGIFITLIFILMPILIKVFIKIDVDIPSILYIILGSLGVVISVVLGLFDWWVLFFILFIGVIIFGLTWFKGGGVTEIKKE